MKLTIRNFFFVALSLLAANQTIGRFSRPLEAQATKANEPTIAKEGWSEPLSLRVESTESARKADSDRWFRERALVQNSYSGCHNQDGRDGYLSYKVVGVTIDSKDSTKDPTTVSFYLIHPTGKAGSFITGAKPKWATSGSRIFGKDMGNGTVKYIGCSQDQAKYDKPVPFTHSVLHPADELQQMQHHN